MRQANLKGEDIKKIAVRLPTDLHAKLTQSAQDNERSINSEIIAILEEKLKGETE